MTTPRGTLPINVAILDLYNGEPNEGMRCIRELLERCDGHFGGVPIRYDVFETRLKGEAPGLDYDLYLSTGGPGSPFDGEGTTWEAAYFGWLDALWSHNEQTEAPKKHAFFICHSFQMMARFFEVAAVRRRRQESFGVLAVHPTEAGLQDPIFEGLEDPFYAADFRHFEVVHPDARRLAELGGTILALEKKRSNVPYERALMGLRLSEEIAGVQFHPEADPDGMGNHFRQAARRAQTIHKIGRHRYERMLHRLDNPHFLARTHDAILPNVIEQAIHALRPESVLGV